MDSRNIVSVEFGQRVVLTLRYYRGEKWLSGIRIRKLNYPFSWKRPRIALDLSKWSLVFEIYDFHY